MLSFIVGVVVYVSIGIIYLMNKLFSSDHPESLFSFGWMLGFVVLCYPYMMYMDVTGKNRKSRNYVNVPNLKKTLVRESDRFDN